MKKFLSLALVISIIISTITMTNVFVASAAGIDDSLVFDLDFTNYNSASTETNKGLVNSVGNTTADFTKVNGMEKGSETINGKTVNYLDSTEITDGIDVVNAAINSSPDITVEAWVKNDTINRHLFLYGNKTGGIWQFQISSYNGGWIPQQSSQQNGSFSMELNQWQHIVATLDRATDSTAATLKVYIDGENVYDKAYTNQSVYLSTADGTDPPFRISGGSYGSQGCDTKFADVKLYKGVMTEAEAKAKYDAEKVNYGIEDTTEEPGTGGDTDEPITDERLVFDLDFSKYDSAATSTNKGLENAAPAASDDKTSEFTKVQNISVGQQDLGGDKFVKYIDTSADGAGIKVENATINSSPDLTFETWVYDNETPDANSRHLFLYGNGTWQLQVQGYGQWQIKAPTAGISTAAQFGYGAKAWHHVVYVLDRGDNVKATLTAYVDGVKAAACEAPSESTYAARPTDYLYISAGMYLATMNYNGKIGDVKIYKAALTEEEVKAKYNGEKASYGIEDPTEEPDPEQPGTDEPGTDEPGTITNKVLIDEDFSGSEYVVGQAPPTDKGLTYWSSGTANDSSDFKVLQTEKGDKYIAGVSNTVNKSSQVFYDFNPDISKGPICLEMAVRGYEPNSKGQGTGARELFRFYTNNGYKSFGNLTPAATLMSTACTISEDGFYHVKVILSKDASDNYLIDIYPTPGSTKYVRVDSTAYMAMKNVQQIMLAHIYPQKDSELGTTGFAISEFKAYYIDVPEIEGDTTIDDLAEGDKTIDVKFSTDMDLTSLKEAEYVLTEQGTENTVPVSFKAYNGETKTLTIQLDAALLPDATYNLTVNGITSAEGMAFDGENMMTVARAKSANLPTAATITAPSVGAESVSASVTLPGGATTTYVFMVFDATGRVKGAMMGEISSASNTITVELPSGSTIKAGDTAKLIFWEKTGETGFVPVTMKPVVVSVGE